MDEETLKSITAAAHSTSAIGNLLTDIVCLLAQHPGVDRNLLIEQMKVLYAPVNADTAFQAVYNNYRERILRGLGRLSKEQGPDRDSE